MERITKATERITFAIVNDTMDILTMFLTAFVHVVKSQCVWIEDKLTTWRTKRGYRVDQFEETIEDWQYERMAESLKMSAWEMANADRLGESIVLQAHNYPNLSRRQARKVMQIWRMIHGIKRKPRKYVRKKSA